MTNKSDSPMSTETKRTRTTFAIFGLLARGFLLYSLLGLPLVIAAQLDWWTPESWMRIPLGIWFIFFGVFVLMAVLIAAAIVFALCYILIDFWFSLVLGCLGVNSALTHFRKVCVGLGDFIILTGTSIKTWDISFSFNSDKK